MLVKVSADVCLEKPLETLILSGDPGCDGYNAESVVVLEHILRLPADLQLVLGDLVPTGQPRWFRQFEAIVAGSAAAPVYCLAGNHDLPDYEAHCGLRDYAIRAPNALVILLDNARRYFTDATVAYLRRSLEENTTPHVFVAFHIPPPNPFVPNHVSQDEWDKLRAALDPHRERIRMLFCGHVHSAFDYELDGYRVIVTGGAGSRLDAVDNHCLPQNRHHAFRLAYRDGAWDVSVIDIDREAAATVFGEDAADRQVAGDLAGGFAGEAKAYRTYQLYAEVAANEGRTGLAKLFRAAAESEFHHSRNMFIASDRLGASLRNLEAAIQREREEVETLYPAALANAAKPRTRRAENAFGCALQAEKVHHRLFREALETLRAGQDIPVKRYFTCARCGYTHAGEHAPVICPACGADRFRFSEVD